MKHTSEIALVVSLIALILGGAAVYEIREVAEINTAQSHIICEIYNPPARGSTAAEITELYVNKERD